MALNDAITALQVLVGAVTGIRSAPTYAPDKMPPGLAAVALPASGKFTVAPAGVLQGIHDVELYIVCPRVDLQKTLATIIPMAETVMAAIESDPTLTSTCDTIGDTTYVFSTSINLGTAEAPAYYAGYIFTITGIKIQDNTILS